MTADSKKDTLMAAREIRRLNYLENLNKPTSRILSEDKHPTTKHNDVKNSELTGGDQLTTSDKITSAISRSEHLNTDN